MEGGSMNPKIATRPLAYIAHSVMTDLRETDSNSWAYYNKWAIDSFRELNLFVLPMIKTVELEVSDTHTIALPDDYIKYTGIGMCLGKHIYLLGRDDNMAFNRTEECDVPIEEVVQNPNNFGYLPYGYFFSGMFRNGQYVGEQFAHGGGWAKGYYRVDLEKKQIQFSNLIPKTKIILEYKSTGMSCDGTVEIPYEAISAMTAYVHWKRVQNDSELKKTRTYALELSDRERQWKIEFNKLKHLTLLPTVQEFLDAKYRTIKSTPKR